MNRALRGPQEFATERREKDLLDRAEATDRSKRNGVECRRNGEEFGVWRPLGGSSGRDWKWQPVPSD